MSPYSRTDTDESFGLATNGAVLAVDERYRQASRGGVRANSNLQTTFTRIVERVGLTLWPRAFQNLQASRETELMEDFPIHVVTEWIGNSESVAKRQYLMVTDEHFSKAVAGEKKPARNPAQQTAPQRCRCAP